MHLQNSSPVTLNRPAELLYFEDNATDSLLVEAQFERESALPVHFTVVPRLRDGLVLLQNRQFDLALLDLNLSDSEGLSSLDTLRHAAPGLPVVVVSGAVNDKLALDTLSHGAQDCLAKGPAMTSSITKAVYFAMRRQQTAIELGLRVREAEAAQSHARTILGASLDAVLVLDMQGIVRFVNPAAEVMFARKASEMLNQPFDLPIVAGNATAIDIIRHNGEKGTAEIRVVEIDWEGHPASLATARDVTESRKLQAALMSSESRLRLLIEHVPLELGMFDRDMRFLQVSRRWISDFGLRGDLRGRSHYEVFPDLPERWKEIHRRALAGEVLRNDDDCYEHADGTLQWLHWEVRPWFEEDDTIGGVVILSEDISERKKMEAALLSAEKLQALGTLAGGIAHDFNNILLAVSGNAKLALEELSEHHAARENVLEIAKASSRAAALTKKIMSFSQQRETKRTAVQIQPIVEEALELLRAALPARIEIHRNFPAKLPAISADASQICQIIVNLASNAAEAIGELPGTLEIAASPIHLNGNGSSLSTKLPQGDYIKVSVRDTGPGIDRKIIGRVLEPFFTTKPQGRGTGMGLAIVYGIVKNHQGEVTVYSEVGKGTVFNLYFPVAGEVPVVLPPPAASPRGEGQHILYVDDEEPLVSLITRTLKRLSYRVTGFTNPLEALQMLRNEPSSFQAIVTDLSMPEMSGMDFAQEARQICPTTPVILTTGYICPQDQDLATRVGIRELILKPDTVEDLGAALHRVLSSAAEINA